MLILGENENPVLWKKNICNAIKDLADIEMQKLTWSGEHAEYISSFTEILGMLYDSFDFERYIEYHRSVEGEDRFYKIISELNAMIDSYQDFGYATESMVNGYAVILNDANWINITNKAKEAVLTEHCKKVSIDRTTTPDSNT